MNRLGAFAFSVAATVGIGVAGCSGSAPAIPEGSGTFAAGQASGLPRPSATGCPCYAVLYNFTGTLNGGTDGDSPTGYLIYANGLFYGETELGGAGRADGTVYSMTPGGAETVLYSFQGGRDGSLPQSGLLNVSGTFYGVTSDGGSNGYGTMFSVTPAGTESVLHSFGSASGGRNPQSSLVDDNGVLFGTTYDGGNLGAGTVFRTGTFGNALTIHSFGGGNDGANPHGLTYYNGLLYGTTFKGGAHGVGTVFSVAPDGSNETVLHSFARDGVDGTGPISRLTELNGSLYGATDSGGVHDRGTIFSITPGGAEKVLLSFNGGFDAGPGGAHPSTDLTMMNGALFGMTNGGGNYQRGMIFRITPNGTLTALHSFGGPGDTAESPVGGRLYPLNGVLYGTTQFGNNTLGVFFSLKP